MMSLNIATEFSKHPDAEDGKWPWCDVERSDSREHPAQENSPAVLDFLKILQDTLGLKYFDRRSDSHDADVVEKRYNLLESVRINERVSVETTDQIALNFL